MGIIKSKHQKLILQCYPQGKGVDKKPNPLELSYLLYYALTRRVKLEKVIEFLKQLTAKDVRGRKSGNLQVTLAIVSALVEKCADNLNVFAKQLCEILFRILTLEELPLCKSIVSTYGVLCSKLDNGLFAGDKLFIYSFSLLTQHMISLGQVRLDLDTTNSREWRILALLTSRYVFNCLSYNSALSQKFVSLCVPILSRAVRNTYSREMLLTLLQSNLNIEQDTMRPLMRTATVKSLATTRKPGTTKAEDESLSEDDLGEEAFAGLKTLFNTISSSQIAEGIRAIESFCFNEKAVELPWGTTFLQTCASFIPVQMRFVALITLLSKLARLSESATANSEQSAELVHAAQYVSGLVSSDFNMIGLATSDVISQLLSLEKYLYLKLALTFVPKEVNALSLIYSKCICDLSTHIYYFDQVRDSVEEIIAHIDDVLANATPENATQARLFALRLLDTIFVILELLSEKSNSIARHRGTLENLDVSLQLLTISELYPLFSSLVSQSEIIDLQSQYLDVVLFFLKKEVVANNEQSADLHAEAVALDNKLMVPNYNSYIDNHENIVARIIDHAKEYYREPSYNVTNEAKVQDVLQTVLELTGINFVRNFVLIFDQWQLKEVTSVPYLRARDTAAYSLLLSSLTVLDQVYADVLKFPLTNLHLSSVINADLDTRKTLGLWISSPNEKTVVVSPGKALINQVTQDDLCEFFSTTAIVQWLRAPAAAVSATMLGRNGTLNSESFDAVVGQDKVNSYQLAPLSAESGLGLGSANDISSIYSELLNSQARVNGHVTPDTSRVTRGSLSTYDSTTAASLIPRRNSLVPRIQDLRHTVNGEEGDDSSLFHDQSHDHVQRSVIQRQIQTTNIESLLDGLHSEDDSKLIV